MKPQKHDLFMISLVVFVIAIVASTITTISEDQKAIEFKEEACYQADNAGTCDSNLEDLGLISKEKCCELFSKCC